MIAWSWTIISADNSSDPINSITLILLIWLATCAFTKKFKKVVPQIFSFLLEAAEIIQDLWSLWGFEAVATDGWNVLCVGKGRKTEKREQCISAQSLEWKA